MIRRNPTLVLFQDCTERVKSHDRISPRFLECLYVGNRTTCFSIDLLDQYFVPAFASTSF